MILRRIIWALLLLTGIFIISWYLELLADPDPALRELEQEAISDPYSSKNVFERYLILAQQKNLNKPDFYFSVRPAVLPDSVSAILPVSKRVRLKKYALRYNSWKKAVELDNSLLKLLNNYTLFSDPMNHEEIKKLEAIRLNKKVIVPNLLPVISWEGRDNRFHHHLKAVFSTGSGEVTPVADVLRALGYTVPINLLALLIVVLISVPAGIFMGIQGGRGVRDLLLILYAIPSFWLGTLWVIFLPATLVWSGEGSLQKWLPPAVCLALPALAFVSSHVSQAVREEAGRPWGRQYLVKGRILFMRALLPVAGYRLLSVLAQLLPAIIMGSVILEVIFNVPGMGRLLLNSLLLEKWPVVSMTVLWISTVTLLGQLLIDILYRTIDPRIHNE